MRQSTHQGQPITTNFYLLTSAGCDIVLGAYWSRTLGPILWEFSSLTQFELEGEAIKLQGESPTNLTLLNVNELQDTTFSKGGVLL